MARLTYFILAEEGQVQNDLEGLGVGGEDDQVGEAAVEGLRGLVGSLLQLYHLTHESETEGARPVPSIVSLERVGSGSASGRGGNESVPVFGARPGSSAP